MYASGPRSTQEDLVQYFKCNYKKGKDKKCKYSMVELMESNSQNIYTHVNFPANDIEISQIYFICIYSCHLFI